MIDIRRLYCQPIASDKPNPPAANQVSKVCSPSAALEFAPRSPLQRKPVVFWNSTRAFQPDLPHSNTHTRGPESLGELTTDEAQRMLRGLAAFGVPAVVLAGGEPLLRTDLLELIAYTEGEGIRPVLLTGGALINHALALRLKRAGTASVFISLDGFDPQAARLGAAGGAVDKVVAGLRHCREAGLKVRVRLTLTRQSLSRLDAFFDFCESENIERVFFCHALDAGRPRRGAVDGLSHAQTRQAIDRILVRAASLCQRAVPLEVFTADNHADGPYLYLKLQKEQPERAVEVFRSLKFQGGARFGAGVGLGAIDSAGNVHPDVFWSHYTFGNVRARAFGEIWQDTSDPLMAGLKDRLPRLKGRCAHCRFQGLCGGNLRVRADLAYGDPWRADPGCYLKNEEVSRPTAGRQDGLENNVLLESKAA